MLADITFITHSLTTFNNSNTGTQDLQIRGAKITKKASSASLTMKSPKKRRESVRRNLDRYTFVSWGSPASHTDKFKKGGTWSKRRKIHKLDRSIRTWCSSAKRENFNHFTFSLKFHFFIEILLFH